MGVSGKGGFPPGRGGRRGRRGRGFEPERPAAKAAFSPRISPERLKEFRLTARALGISTSEAIALDLLRNDAKLVKSLEALGRKIPTTYRKWLDLARSDPHIMGYWLSESGRFRKFNNY